MRTVFKIGAYPKKVTLNSGQQVTIRPLQVGDASDLREFFRGIPAGDRFFLGDDVMDPAVIDRWTSHVDYFRALPLVAISDGKIAADGVLLRGHGAARAHTAEIRLSVAPRLRGTELAGLLLEELCRIARDAGLDLVYLEVMPDRDEELVRAARRLG
ncbi:MAG TPA: GNAT family N-acetyltransferase, partial [Dehalococcoidia bacterium]|nr:GNAT family N-acetyltransferase [Dehalococcoidia bacterium]